VQLYKTHFVEARASEHVTSGELSKALDYTLCAARRNLKLELRGKSGAEIAAMRQEQGENAVTEVKIERLVGYSGDAPKLEPARWNGVKLLIHEATFLEPDTARHSHSNLPDVIAAAAQLEIEALVLIHFSARHKADEIEQAIREHARAASLRFPVFAVLPGQIVTDLLAAPPVWSPAR
jgi:ribonuclease Z